MKKIKIITLLILFAGVVGTYIGLRFWIKSDVDRVCEHAMAQYQGGKTEALIAILNADIQSLEAKNDAIWALGKLQDTSALPVLKSLKTGAECDHNQFVCQRELDKAIEKLEGRNFDLFQFK